MTRTPHPRLPTQQGAPSCCRQPSLGKTQGRAFRPPTAALLLRSGPAGGTRRGDTRRESPVPLTPTIGLSLKKSNATPQQLPWSRAPDFRARPWPPPHGAPSPRPPPSPPSTTNLRPAKGRRLGHSPPPRPLRVAAAAPSTGRAWGTPATLSPAPRRPGAARVPSWPPSVREAPRAGWWPEAGVAGGRAAQGPAGRRAVPPLAKAQWCRPAGKLRAPGLNGQVLQRAGAGATRAATRASKCGGVRAAASARASRDWAAGRRGRARCPQNPRPRWGKGTSLGWTRVSWGRGSPGYKVQAGFLDKKSRRGRVQGRAPANPPPAFLPSQERGLKARDAIFLPPRDPYGASLGCSFRAGSRGRASFAASRATSPWEPSEALAPPPFVRGSLGGAEQAFLRESIPLHAPVPRCSVGKRLLLPGPNMLHTGCSCPSFSWFPSVPGDAQS